MREKGGEMGDTKLTRRTFLGAMGALGALSVAGAGVGAQASSAYAATEAFPAPKKGKPIEADVDLTTGDVTVNEDVLVRYSGCVGCYCACGARVKLDRASGKMIGVGGNPYSPACAWPTLPFDASLEDAYRSLSYTSGYGNVLRGTVCGRGNAMFDAVTQPRRVTTPLKRAGKRGEGKWKPISWDQLIQEITEGGVLFADQGETQVVEGFKQVRDTETLIDPAQPELGPKSNQIILWSGRADGRGKLSARFTSTFGTLNQFTHNSS